MNFLVFIIPFFMVPNQCLATEVNMCYNTGITAEQYLLTKKIKYQMWGNGPVYYDCWGVLTEAYRKEWYRWQKIHSWTYDCVKSPRNASPWDVLVKRDEPRHVALITSYYHEWAVTILDYFEKNTKSSYRKYPIDKHTAVLSHDCLLSIK